MKNQSPTSAASWEKTNVPNLYRHPKGVYYARYRMGKQDVWRSLRTKVKSVAVYDLSKVLDAIAVRRGSGLTGGEGSMRFKDAQALYVVQLEGNSKLSDNTKRLRLNGIKRLAKSWPELAEMSVRKITSKQIVAWFKQIEQNARPYVPIKAKRAVRRSTGKSATTLNSELDSLRLILDVAVMQGYIPVNPGRHPMVKRVVPTQKELRLPSRGKFVDLVNSIRGAGVQHCVDAADMVTLLALTGVRLGQARGLLWQHVDFEERIIFLQKSKRTPPREVPIGGELVQLLHRMRSERTEKELAPDQPVLRIKECLGFLTSACEKVNLERLTHHDLRHLFATTAIEQNIDVPRVAALLGHADGGALAMKVYGHSRQEHLRAAVDKLKFGLNSC